MTATANPQTAQIQALLADNGYQVSESGPGHLKIRETHSGVSLEAVLQGDVLYLSLVCTVVPPTSITPEVMSKMLAADNGISTSYFQLYNAGAGQVAVTLNNFCKVEAMSDEDEDEILSCIHFLLVDVMSARRLLNGLAA
jgi:hypothetical protein